MLEQVLSSLGAIHGYLSSPTGGGVRHGAELKSSITIGPADGRLYCNLIRSYIIFLMSEHERLSRESGDQR
ncbi:Ynb (fragment) [Mesorhizobium metallidurans STM 2683]|uniref:Ynb n=1 Tax=Mesorhizobium metallidurans STM 2683 TaxID=1297569 RepID=M5EXB3_9HYPH